MYLSDFLNKKNNNIDIFRFICACLVIYGHSNAMMESRHVDDFVFRVIGYDYSGGLSVKIFFFLSGLVVTNSLIQKKNIRQFIASRVFRIFPALFVVLAFSAFIIGPLFSNETIGVYFRKGDAALYFFKNVMLHTTYEIPGVFSSNHRSGINGSIWSIPYEVYCYIILGCLYVLGAFSKKIIITFILLLVIIDSSTGNNFIFTWLRNSDHDLSFLPLCFSIGCLMSVWKERIKVNTSSLVSIWIVFYFFQNEYIKESFLYICIFFTIVYLSSTRLLNKVKFDVDLSYGIYLWGWVLQQSIITIYPSLSSIQLTIATIPLSALISYVSWRLIEKPMIMAGRKIN